MIYEAFYPKWNIKYIFNVYLNSWNAELYPNIQARDEETSVQQASKRTASVTDSPSSRFVPPRNFPFSYALLAGKRATQHTMRAPPLETRARNWRIPEATSDRSPVSKHRPCWTPLKTLGAKTELPRPSPESWRPRARDKSWRHTPEPATDVLGFARVLPNKADDFHANASRDGPIPLVRPANAEGGDWRHSSRPCFWLFSRFRGGGWVGVCSRVFGIEPWVQSFFFFFRKIKTQFWKSACSKMGNSNWKDSSWTFWKIGFLQLSRGMEFVLLRNRIENWIWLYVCIYIYICSVFYFNLFLSLIRLIFFFFFRNSSSFVYSI